MTVRAAGSALAVAVACAAGCGSGASHPGEPVGSSVSSIQGGTTDSSHSFAVGICGSTTGPGGTSSCQILCSGALIAPNLVISARHCFDNVSSTTVNCAGDMFLSRMAPASDYFVTTDADMNNPGADWYVVSQIVTPTPTGFCGNDLSLLILDKNVPASKVATLATPEIWYPVDAPQFSTNLTAIGYGLDSPNDLPSAGVRRRLENVPISCIPHDTHKALACAPVAESGIASNEFEGGNGLCEGDSGSSAFEQNAFSAGKFLALGVLSRGGATGNACQGSVYTQLYPWQSLILSTANKAAALGHYSLPEWTTPPPDAGTAAPDAGKGTRPVGASCTASGECASGDCVALGADAGSVCSEACSKTGTCPNGYACMKDHCFRGASGDGGADPPSPPGGCDVASGGKGAGAFWVLALGLAALARRRRLS